MAYPPVVIADIAPYKIFVNIKYIFFSNNLCYLFGSVATGGVVEAF
jgi:hypothetical protein